MALRHRSTIVAGLVALASLLVAPELTGSAASAATVGDACNSSATAPAYCPVPWGSEAWRPRLGAMFNEPRGTKTQRQVITTAEVQAINHTRRGQLIQMATYIFDYPPMTSAVIRAYKRGVNVQLVVDSSRYYGGARQLAKLVGHNPNKPSFVVACWHRCRDGIKKHRSRGAMHAKLIAISRTGAASYWMLRTGGNLSDRASAFQWNEAYAVSQDPVLWGSWQTYFSQMAHQYKKNGRSRVIESRSYDGLLGLEMQRAASAAASSAYLPAQRLLYNAKTDDLITRMRQVGCTAPAGYGVRGHTLIRIMMHSWYGVRGDAIAHTLSRKVRQGCVVQFLSDDGSPWDIGIMQHHGVKVRATDWGWNIRHAANSDGQTGWGPTFYAHLKVMMVNGVYQGAPMRVVWAGSQDWGSLGASEELTMEIRSDEAYRAYNHEFLHLRRTASHRTGIRPLGPPPGGHLPGRV